MTPEDRPVFLAGLFRDAEQGINHARTARPPFQQRSIRRTIEALQDAVTVIDEIGGTIPDNSLERLRALYLIVTVRELHQFIKTHKLDKATIVEQWHAVHYVYFASDRPTATDPPDIDRCVSLYREYLRTGNL